MNELVSLLGVQVLTGVRPLGKPPFTSPWGGNSPFSATLEFEYAMEFYENAIGEKGNGRPPHEIHFPRNNSEPCLLFLVRSNSSMLWNSVKMLLARKATEDHLMKSTFLEITQSPVSCFCCAQIRVCYGIL